MGNISIKYGNGYSPVKVLTTEADQVAGQYEVYATLIHEWGATIVTKTRATRSSLKNYTITYDDLDMRSNGVYKVKWEYKINGDTYIDYDTITVYTPYATENSFFEKYSYLDTPDNNDMFDSVEKKVRNIINTYCGQKFEYYQNITFTLDGSGGRELSLPLRIENMSEALSYYSESLGDTTTDESDSIEKSPDSDGWYIRWKSPNGIFKPYISYKITGDWGWTYVPENVTQAAELLIAEQFNDDNAYRNHGVTDIYMDTHRMRIVEEIVWNSTGYVDADVLLMDYIKYEVSWV